MGSVAALVRENFTTIMLALFLVYRYYQSRQPFPEAGGRVTSVGSMVEWRALLKKSTDEKKVVCAEFYATW